MLTIAQFSDRTGISPSALRFYERKGLLLPAGRWENGYRYYTPEQVEPARLINSLRETGVSVADVGRFLALDSEGRGRLLLQWRQEVAARLLSIQMADQYLTGLHPEEPQIHLLRWEEASLFVWFPAEVEPLPLPFRAEIARRGKGLERLGFTILSGGYVRTLDLVDGRLIGEVGFRVKPGRRKPPQEARAEHLPPVLFATLECGVQDDQSAHRVFRFLAQFGFNPAGVNLERYLDGVADRYQLLIAVARD